MNPKVLIGTITYDSDWYCLKQFADSINKLELGGIDFEHLIIDNSDTEDYCKQLKKFFPKARLIHYPPPEDIKGFDRFRHCEITCRQMVVDYFLNHDIDYLFFVDSDVICEPDVLKKLLAKEKDIICGLFRYRAPPNGRPLWFRRTHPTEISKETGVWKITFITNEEVENLGDVLEIDCCGFGAILIKREVLGKVKLHKSPNDHYGADIHFCYDAKLLGYRIFGDPFAKCNHLYKRCARRLESNAHAF